MKEKVLITGGTGLIGSKLSTELVAQGYQVCILSRKERNLSNIKTYLWNIEKNFIDKESLVGTDYIIHLAGAGISDKRWSDKQKKIILESRIKSADLIFNTLTKDNLQPKAFISASGISIYGDDKGDTLLDENSSSESTFLAEVVKHWEKVADQFKTLGLRVVKLRTGIVLSAEAGALAKIIKPIKYGFGANLGSGKQYISWIHVRDMVKMYIYAIQNSKIEGVYNAVAPEPVTNKSLTKLSAKFLNKPLFLPNVPSFALKLMLGEMAQLVLGGLKVSGQKVLDTGFEFEFNNIEKALKNLLDK